MNNSNEPHPPGGGAHPPDHAPQAGHHDPRHEIWKLNVQGVVIETNHPEIVVRHAIKQAGFNPDTPWIIILKVAGEPKREVDLTSVIDLRHHGIEKLRLTPRHINNGEARGESRAAFPMLPEDEALLDRLALDWETLVDNGRRWLMIRNYPLPAGYQVAAATLGVEVPVSYPGAQLDMFYCHPPLALISGAVIPQTQHVETVLGLPFQRWSRHRPWNPVCDTLATHLALIDTSLLQEVGQ